MSASCSEMRWAFERPGGDGETTAVVVDARGLLLTISGEEERRVAWKQIDAVRWSAPAQQVSLELGADRLALPFDLEGEGGDFDDLLRLVLDGHADRGVRSGEEARTFGAWRLGRLLLWLFAAALGVGLAIGLGQGRTHWLIPGVLSGLWVMAVRYAGFSTEVRISTAPDGVVVHRPWGRRTFGFGDLAAVTVTRQGRAASRRLVLEIRHRGGGTTIAGALGDEVLDAYGAIRRAASAHHRDGARDVTR